MKKDEVKKVARRAKKKAATKELNVVPSLSELIPRENCVLCGGRGTLTMITKRMRADRFRVVVPCKCASRIIAWVE